MFRSTFSRLETKNRNNLLQTFELIQDYYPPYSFLTKLLAFNISLTQRIEYRIHDYHWRRWSSDSYLLENVISRGRGIKNCTHMPMVSKCIHCKESNTHSYSPRILVIQTWPNISNIDQTQNKNAMVTSYFYHFDLPSDVA